MDLIDRTHNHRLNIERLRARFPLYADAIAAKAAEIVEERELDVVFPPDVVAFLDAKAQRTTRPSAAAFSAAPDAQWGGTLLC